MLKSSLLRNTAYALLASLYFVWPLPHTIALRFSLLALTVFYFSWLLFLFPANQSKPLNREFRILLVLIGVLTMWILCNALWISDEPVWALSEIAGQWVNPLIAGLLGAMVGLAVMRDVLPLSRVVMTLVLALAAHTLFLDITALYAWLIKGEAARRSMGLTDGPDKSNYLTIAFLGFVFSEIYLRAVARKRFLPLNKLGLWAFAVLGLLGFYLEEIRNGVAPVAAILLSFLMLYIVAHRTSLRPLRLSLHIAIALLVTSGLVLFMVKTDARWQNTIDSAKFAWQTQDNSAWLFDDKPKKQSRLPNGKPIEESSYLRTAMIKEGLQIIAAHPFGVGYGRNAFGHALTSKYGRGGGHSHSGILDFTIGLGVPGFLLWVSFLIYAGYLGARAFLREQSYAGIVLLVVVLTFAVRMIFDSIIRDHMFQQFMFTAALFATLALRDYPDQSVHA